MQAQASSAEINWGDNCARGGGGGPRKLLALRVLFSRSLEIPQAECVFVRLALIIRERLLELCRGPLCDDSVYACMRIFATDNLVSFPMEIVPIRRAAIIVKL